MSIVESRTPPTPPTEQPHRCFYKAVALSPATPPTPVSPDAFYKLARKLANDVWLIRNTVIWTLLILPGIMFILYELAKGH
jgi:hypothetical protein